MRGPAEPSSTTGWLIQPPGPATRRARRARRRSWPGWTPSSQAGLLHDFEESKRTFIGGHGKTPVLLVQGPPGTGKSY